MDAPASTRPQILAQHNAQTPANDGQPYPTVEQNFTYPYQGIRVCTARCGFKGLPSEFSFNASMKQLKTCKRCLDKQAAMHASPREKENIPEHPHQGRTQEGKGSW